MDAPKRVARRFVPTISLKQGIIWYVLTIGLVSILYALDVNRFLVGTIYQILILGFAIAPLYVDRRSRDALGLVKIKWWIGLLIFLGSAIAQFVYYWFTGGDITIPKLDFRLLYIIALAPVCEEFFFRGYLQRAMEVKIGKWIGFLIMTILFTIAHLPKIFILQEGSAISILVIFVIGAIFGIIRLKTGSLYYSILSHVGANLMSIFFIVLKS